MKLVNLKSAGYPFEKNDLSPEDWEDMGIMTDVLRNNEKNKPVPVYIVKAE